MHRLAIRKKQSRVFILFLWPNGRFLGNEQIDSRPARRGTSGGVAAQKFLPGDNSTPRTQFDTH